MFYGQSETYASSSPVSATASTSHRVVLAGLKSGTNYFYKVVSKDALGEASKSGFEFNTLYKQKTIAVAPTISHVAVESIGTSGAVIVFDTDIPAAGKVNYGTTTGYEETDGGHTTFLTDHSHPLSGLSPDTLYNFEVVVRDVSGNETIYENVTFTTLASALSSESSQTVQGSSGQATTPTPSPSPTPSSGGGGSWVGYHAPQTRVVGKPVVTKVDPLDKQVLFVWKAASQASGLQTVIVRSENGYVTYPYQGVVVYQGNSGRFADINLQNGKKYYYSVFRTDQSRTYSKTLNFTVVPKEGKTQTQIIATPPVVQKTPIYTFSKVLSRGDKNKQVEHLQVLLASEPSIYQRGLITGYFGALTENAVKAFQRRYKLQVTGIADVTTLKKLEKLSSIEVVKDKVMSLDNSLSIDLGIGSAGQDVSLLQQLLINFGVYPEALVTGYFGRLTRSALQKFQKQQNINPANGYLGSITKKRILNLMRLRNASF